MADKSKSAGPAVGLGVDVPPMKDTHAPAIKGPTPGPPQSKGVGSAAPLGGAGINTNRVIPHKELDSMFNGNTWPTGKGPAPKK